MLKTHEKIQKEVKKNKLETQELTHKIENYAHLVTQFEHQRMDKYYSQVSILDQKVRQMFEMQAGFQDFQLQSLRYFAGVQPLQTYSLVAETLNQALQGNQLNQFIEQQPKKLK